MTVIERLESYYDFDETVLESADKVAYHQKKQSWQEFLDYCNMSPQSVALLGRTAIEYIEFCPKRQNSEYDSSKARVFYAPMGNPLDPNIAYQAATVFAFDPRTRLFAIANPSGPGRNSGLLDTRQRRKVARGDLTPTIEPVLKMLHDKGIANVSHAGSSYGAEKAATAVAVSSRFDQEVKGMVAIEPPAVKRRSLLRLGLDFASSNSSMEGYVAASDIPAFESARRQSITGLDFGFGLLRASNLAIARCLTEGSFECRLFKALNSQKSARLALAWGTSSELADDASLNVIANHLDTHYGDRRQISRMRLEGQKHALMNDIHLQAALVMQGLRGSVPHDTI